MTMNTIPPDQMHVHQMPSDSLRIYQFGSMTARHHFCGTCGIHTFVETRLNPGHYRINLGCVEGVDAMRLPETLYDGQSLE